MPRYVLDYTILLELATPESAWHEAARQTVDDLRRQGHSVAAFESDYMDLWNTLTKPAMLNGHNRSPDAARATIDALRAQFHPLRSESESRWMEVAIVHGLTGNDVHLARMLALMEDGGVTHLLSADPPMLPDPAGVEIVVFAPVAMA